MTDRNYVSTALPAVLSSALGASGNPVVASLPGTWPPEYPFPALIDWGLPSAEAILVTSAPTGTGPYVLPCTRGIDGTTQQAHSAGAIVVHGTTGYEPTQIQDNAAAIAALVISNLTVPAGDLGGTGTAPVVAKIQGTVISPPPTGGGATTEFLRGDGTWAAPPGGLTATAVQTTSPVTAAGQTFIPVDASGGAITVNLPAAPPDGTVAGVKMIKTAGGNKVTVSCGGSDVLNVSAGATSLTLSVLMQGAVLQYKASGAIWYVTGDDLPLGQLETLFPQRAAGTSSPAAPLPYYNPLDDGAVFNGTTDDSADINTTLARGNTIALPPGTTLANANILRFQASNVHVKGAGMYDTVVRCTNGSLAAIWAYPASGFISQVELSDMTIDGTGVTAEALAQIGSRLDRLRIRRVRFQNFPSAIIYAGYAAELIIEDCEADGAGLAEGTFLVATNVEFESVIIRRCRLRWLNTGISIGSGNPTGNQYHSAYVDICDNYIDLGWWLLKAASSNSGGTVTYSATTVTDSSAPFGATNSMPAGNTIRVLAPLQTGTLTTIGTQVTDTSGNFVTAGVWRGHIIRSGSAFGVVSKVETATQLHVEEWLSQTTYQPVTPPSSASYTAYGVVLGAVVSNTSTAVTIAHGAGGNGGGWYDLQGNSVTPSSGTLYEVLPAHPVYPVFINVPVEKVRVSRNTIRRGWADGIEFFGSRGIIEGNIVEDGQDEGIVVLGYSATYPGIKNLVSGNISRHNGTSGMDIISQADCEIGPNQLEDNTWGTPVSGNLGQIQLAGCVNTTVTGGRATNSGESALNQAGMAISGSGTSGVKVTGFSGHGAALGDVYVTSTVPAAACDLLDIDGTLTYQTTTNGQRLRVKGSGAPSLVASPGSVYLSSGGGSGTTLYVKETGNGSGGWTAYGAGGGGGVSSVTAGDTSVIVGGSGSAPTIETATIDVIAADHPPAANWSNNSKKITSLANGSGAQDAAAFGQLPSSSSPLALTQGGTGLSESSDAALLTALGAAQTASNLSDLASASAAVTNLGLNVSTQWVTATGSYTWNKPAGAQTVDIILCAGGGGGASGAVEISGNAGGGGGGGGGALTQRTFAAADLPSSVTGSVGTGGNGGTAVSGTTAGSGVNGSSGNSTTFGAYAVAGGGNVGAQGTTSGGNGAAATAQGTSPGGTGGAGGAAAAGSPSAVYGAATGGGGGGGADTGTAFNGGTGEFSAMGSSSNTAAGGTAGGSGPSSGSTPAVKGTPGPGGGGGGGTNTAGATAQTGAAGVYGGGGGGGGGAFYPGSGGAVTSGTGGAGGSGFALIVSHFT